MPIKQLKAHLAERGIDTTGAVEKEDYIALALQDHEGGPGKVHKVDGNMELSEHLCEA